MSDESAAAQAVEPGRSRRARSVLFEIVETLVLTVVIFVGIQAFVAPVERAHVIGRGWLRYWPFDTFGVLEGPTYAAVPAP